MSKFATLFILIVVVSMLSSSVFQNSSFAQMESLKITGNQYPEINSIFNVNIMIEGTSRASGSTFNIQYEIYQKDNLALTDHGVMDVYSGTNKLKINLETGLLPYKPNVPYVLVVHHLDSFVTFEFVPVDKSSEVSPPSIETKPSSSTLEQLTKENQKLKKQLEDKNAIIMEQIKVIQNLASVIRNAIFEPILNYFEV
jgi:hypothetical protein